MRWFYYQQHHRHTRKKKSELHIPASAIRRTTTEFNQAGYFTSVHSRCRQMRCTQKNRILYSVRRISLFTSIKLNSNAESDITCFCGWPRNSQRKFPSLKSHQPPLNCQNRYYRLYMCREVKPSLNRRVVFQMVETGNGDFLEYNIYLTRGWGPNMVSFPWPIYAP